MKTLIGVFASLFFVGSFSSFAANPSGAPSPTAGMAAEKIPSDLKKASITEKLGQKVPISELKFKNESGQEVSLASYFSKGRPVILSLVYFGCPSLCNFVLNGMVDTLKQMSWEPGQQFEILTVSIDPKEDAEAATLKKGAYIEEYGNKNAEHGWHFLTGSEDQIQKLADSVGFGFFWDAQQKEYAHSATLMILTAEGVVSRYLYGITFLPKDLRLALLEASDGKVGTFVDRVLMYCYRYDPHARGYSLVVFRIMQAAGVLMTLLVGVVLFFVWRMDLRNRKARSESVLASGIATQTVRENS